MENYDLLYPTPVSKEPTPPKVSLYQAVKAMIFGLVALTLSEIPFFGVFVVPPFAIISLCMGSDFKKRFPGYGNGFLKAGKITAIISLPLCVLTTIFYIIYIASMATGITGGYYY